MICFISSSSSRESASEGEREVGEQTNGSCERGPREGRGGCRTAFVGVVGGAVPAAGAAFLGEGVGDSSGGNKGDTGGLTCLFFWMIEIDESEDNARETRRERVLSSFHLVTAPELDAAVLTGPDLSRPRISNCRRLSSIERFLFFFSFFAFGVFFSWLLSMPLLDVLFCKSDPS